MHHLAQILSLDNLAANMVLVEGGTFEMGGESILDNAKPIHPVKLDDFYICRYPVSQLLWHQVMGKAPERLMFKNQNRPVERVSWNDIEQEFLPKLREKPGFEDFCLPTEAQWEYAARGGKYRNSNSFKADFEYAGSNDLKEVAWFNQNSYAETIPTGIKRPNALGLYDMSGNVWEWCQDKYSKEYYKELVEKHGDRPVESPVGPESGGFRVVRGGSWDSIGDSSRVANRFAGLPYDRLYGRGFRLCRYPIR